MLYDPAGRDAVQRLADMAPKSATPTSGGAGAWQAFKDYVTGALTNKTLGAGLGWAFGGLPGAATRFRCSGRLGGDKGSEKRS